MNREPQIQVFRIAHSDGSYIEVSNLGARWLSWVVSNGNGKYSDILLGYPTVLDYLQDDCYMGAIVGRFANRIGGATFSLEDHEYTLEKNDGANTNHGGYSGFHSKIWKGSYEGNKIVFRLSSTHLEGGYPGNVEVTVSYSFTSDGMVSIDFDGVSDRLTVLNLTNHAYFNLAGKGDILQHRVTIPSSYILETNAEFIPSGGILPVEATEFDFRYGKNIGKDIEKQTQQLEWNRGYNQACMNLNRGENSMSLLHIREYYFILVGIYHRRLSGSKGISILLCVDFVLKLNTSQIFRIIQNSHKGLCFLRNLITTLHYISFLSYSFKIEISF